MNTNTEHESHRKISVVVDAELDSALRAHQAELRASTGLRPSLSETACSLLRQRLQQVQQPAG